MLPQSWEKATAEHWPFYPQFAKIGDSFAQQISATIAGSETVDVALTKAQQDLTGIMKDSGGSGGPAKGTARSCCGAAPSPTVSPPQEWPPTCGSRTAPSRPWRPASRG